LLFLTYINDIGEKLLSLSRLFADDTSLGYSSQNVVEIENVIYPIFHRHIQKLGGYILSTVFLDFVHLTYI
jgi:hypothetical protein